VETPARLVRRVDDTSETGMGRRSHFWHLVFLAQVAIGCPLAIPSCAIAAEVTKSSVDDRTYEGFVLSNGLKVLAISDPNTDKAAAAMDVAVGSAHDPHQREGLAHFLEHMLFLGTKKYPKAGEYKQFITTHGGSRNAYTAFEDTNYYFDIDSQFLAPALDRFAQFFLTPLFSPDYIDHERQVIHAEYRSKLRSDLWRTLDAKKQAVNPAHPFARFSIGTVETLSDGPTQTIKEELLNFYRTHYSADRMALVVLGKQSIPVLRRWITEKFIAITRHPLRKSTALKKPPLFNADDLPQRIYIAPVGSRRSLSLVFPIPSTRAYFREKPVSYLASLIGHEGEGSLFSALKRAGWAFELQAGQGLDHESEATFNVSIQLTELGKSHLDDIVALFFQYVELIKANGIAERIFREQQRIAEIKFRFQDNLEPIVYVRRLAANLHRYSFQDVIHGPYIMQHYDPGLIGDYLRFLKPDNLLVTVLSDGVRTNAVSPWFQAEYRKGKIRPQEVKQWQRHRFPPELFLPSPNQFLPEDFSLKSISSATDTPELLQQNDGYELWYHQDNSYGTPRANFYLTVRSPLANDNPSHAALTKLYVGAVKDSLSEFFYPAKRAGLRYDMYHHIRGFSLRVSGFNDKEHLLVARIIKEMRNPDIEQSAFKRIKTGLLRKLNDDRRRKPYRRSVSELPTLLVRPHWSDEEQANAMRALGVKDLKAFVPQLLARISLIALAHGNFTRSEALNLGKVVQAGLWRDAIPVSVPNGRVLKLTAGDELIRQVSSNHSDSAVAIYFQGFERSDRMTAQFSLLRQIIATPFYHDLRTERQLGYVVFSALTPLLGTPGITFVIQSPTTDSGTLERQVDNFISHYQERVTLMTDEEFENHKAGLLTRMLEAEQTLKERTDRYWDEINQLHYRFNSHKRLAAAVRRISKPEFEEFYRSSLLAARRKRLTIRCVGTAHKPVKLTGDRDVERTFIEDRRLFAKDREYFSGVPLPLVTPATATTSRTGIRG
jgi:insulysin